MKKPVKTVKKSAKAKASKPRAKGTGPSKRTPAQRAAIDKRAAEASKKAKREQRKAAKPAAPHARKCPTCSAPRGASCVDAKGAPVKTPHVARLSSMPATSKIAAALKVECPTCKAKPGIECFARDGRQVPTPHRLRLEAGPPKGVAKFIMTSSYPPGRVAALDNRRFLPVAVNHASPGVPTIDVDKVVIGKRHRKDFSHVPDLAQSINDRGGLLQPIALRPDNRLIEGESRIKAWRVSKFAGQPIPYHVIDVDSIVAGEWDANAIRKDFTPSEAVAIKREVQAEVKKLAEARAKVRPSSSRAAPGRKASGEREGRVADKVAAFTGVKRRSMEKAEKVVAAAEADPAHRDLVDQMDKSGSINAAFKKLGVRQAKAEIVKAPPVLPMNAAECATWSIDFPWAAEPDKDQAAIDAAGRAFRPYPEMTHKTVCEFARTEIAPKLPAVVSVWLWVTNFILVRGYHSHVIAALGFKPENAATMLTWDKVDAGRGQKLREQTEHAILLTRGKPLIDLFGEAPPSTLIREARRENSRKPEAFYRLVERVTPAKRYAAIFSQGGEGELWDGHGDQVGKFAPASGGLVGAPAHIVEAEAAPAQSDAERFANDELAVLEAIAREETFGAPDLLDSLNERGFIAGKKKRKITKAGRARMLLIRAERAEAQALANLPDEAPAASALDGGAERRALAGLDAGTQPDDLVAFAKLGLARRGYVAGKKTLRLTNLGKERLAALNAAADQIDLEDAIAAKAAPAPEVLAVENPSTTDLPQDADRGLVLAAPENSIPSADEQGPAPAGNDPPEMPAFLRRPLAEAV